MQNYLSFHPKVDIGNDLIKFGSVKLKLDHKTIWAVFNLKLYTSKDLQTVSRVAISRFNFSLTKILKGVES